MQRQQQAEGGKSSSSSPAAKKTQVTKFRSNEGRRPKGGGKYQGAQRSFSHANSNKERKKGSNAKDFSKKTKKPKEKAFKKPKHLKRKLETADDETMKEKLLQEIQWFESKKSLHNTQKPSSKKVKTDETTSDENQIPETEHKPEKEESFPRSKTKAPTEVAKKIEENPKKEVTTKKTAAKSKKKQHKKEKEEAGDENDDDNSSSSDDNSASSSDSDGSDEEQEEQEEEQQTRTRGRRRRGRKSTSQRVEEKQKEETIASQDQSPEQETKVGEGGRYCLGRKPVTDFQVGQKYSGRVVYMKPFGVFIDIGCHSDAFCHISRISDDYVERPEDLFRAGAEVKGVRIVEVDRKNKRLTASLQSEARMADEHASIQARRERKDKDQNRKRQKSNNHNRHRDQSTDNPKPSQRDKKFSGSSDTGTPPMKEKEIPKPASTASLPAKPESDMTPAELKRARKIARRAARRAHQETKQ